MSLLVDPILYKEHYLAQPSEKILWLLLRYITITVQILISPHFFFYQEPWECRIMTSATMNSKTASEPLNLQYIF